MTINQNWKGTNETTLAKIQSDGAVSTAGTLIYSASFGIDGNVRLVKGGNVSRDKEIILKNSSTYRFLIESNTASNIITYIGEWYEHTPKNDTN